MIRPLQNRFEEVLEIPTQDIASFLDVHLQYDGATVSLTYFDENGLFDTLRCFFQHLLATSRDDLPVDWDSSEAGSESIRNLASFIERPQDYCRFLPSGLETNSTHCIWPFSDARTHQYARKSRQLGVGTGETEFLYQSLR